jgi:hypothetical protein
MPHLRRAVIVASSSISRPRSTRCWRTADAGRPWAKTRSRTSAAWTGERPSSKRTSSFPVFIDKQPLMVGVEERVVGGLHAFLKVGGWSSDDCASQNFLMRHERIPNRGTQRDPGREGRFQCSSTSHLLANKPRYRPGGYSVASPLEGMSGSEGYLVFSKANRQAVTASTDQLARAAVALWPNDGADVRMCGTHRWPLVTASTGQPFEPSKSISCVRSVLEVCGSLDAVRDGSLAP